MYRIIRAYAILPVQQSIAAVFPHDERYLVFAPFAPLITVTSNFCVCSYFHQQYVLSIVFSLYLPFMKAFWKVVEQSFIYFQICAAVVSDWRNGEIVRRKWLVIKESLAMFRRQSCSSVTIGTKKCSSPAEVTTVGSRFLPMLCCCRPRYFACS